MNYKKKFIIKVILSYNKAKVTFIISQLILRIKYYL